jgi:hypothetical protein
MAAVGGDEEFDMTIISRRELLRSSGSALICLLAGRSLRAKPAAATKPLKLSLMQEFLKKKILNISPDGMKLCFENWGDAEYPLEVVEIGTGKMIFTGIFQTRVWSASFFLNSRDLIAETRIALDSRISVPHLTLVDLQTGERTESQHFPNNPYEDDPVVALHTGILLVDDIDWKFIEKSSLVLVEFPTYREIAKVPFVIKSDESERSTPGNSRTGISDDRSIFVYSYGRTLVCRRTKDLEVLWIRKIEPPLGARTITSPNANYVAVAIADRGFQRDQQKESYISIYNGKTGADISRLPICGTEGLALSPDGSLLAVAESKPDKNKKEYLLIVHIYDVKSGSVLASIEHDRIKSQRFVATKAVCRVYFTADGQHLISSGMNTKVWKLIRNEG